MIAQFASRQFLVFLVTGGTAAAVNFGSRILLSHWLSFSGAIIIAYLLGMVVAYLLASMFVFEKDSSRPLGRSVSRFVLVNVIAIAQTWLVSMGLLYWVFPRMGPVAYADELAHGIGVIVPVFSSFIGHKKWTFGD